MGFYRCRLKAQFKFFAQKVMKKQEPQLIPVEKYFDEFVKGFGGEKISDELSKRPEFKQGLPDNADYFFRSDGVIAELKCLEEDTYSVEEFRDMLKDLYEEWNRNGLINEMRFGTTFFQTKDLPFECQLEIEKLVNKRLRKVIIKANKQIKLTKELLKTPDAKGVLLLASDGNYFLQPNHVLGYAGRILKSRFSSINSLIYFTVNMAVESPNTDRDALMWVEGHRDNIERVDSHFLNRLCKGWVTVLEHKTGEEIPIHQSEDHSLVDNAKFIRNIFIPCRVKGVNARRPVQATLEFDDIYRIISAKPSDEQWQFLTGEMVRCKEQKLLGGRVGLIAYEKYDDVLVTIRKNKLGQQEFIMRPVNSASNEERIIIPDAEHKFYSLSLAATRRINPNESQVVHEASSVVVKTPKEAYEYGLAEAREKWPESDGWSHNVMIKEVNLSLKALMQRPRKE